MRRSSDRAADGILDSEPSHRAHNATSRLPDFPTDPDAPADQIPSPPRCPLPAPINRNGPTNPAAARQQPHAAADPAGDAARRSKSPPCARALTDRLTDRLPLALSSAKPQTCSTRRAASSRAPSSTRTRRSGPASACATSASSTRSTCSRWTSCVSPPPPPLPTDTTAA